MPVFLEIIERSGVRFEVIPLSEFNPATQCDNFEPRNKTCFRKKINQDTDITCQPSEFCHPHSNRT